jgi:hypothetical protein
VLSRWVLPNVPPQLVEPSLLLMLFGMVRCGQRTTRGLAMQVPTAAALCSLPVRRRRAASWLL